MSEHRFNFEPADWPFANTTNTDGMARIASSLFSSESGRIFLNTLAAAYILAPPADGVSAEQRIGRIDVVAEMLRLSGMGLAQMQEDIVHGRTGDGWDRDTTD